MLRTRLHFALLILLAAIEIPLLPNARSFADESVLPIVKTDHLVIRKKGTYATKAIAGVIEEISGQAVVLRRDSSDVEVYSLRDIVSIHFQKSVEFDEGLIKLRQKDYKAAATAFQVAASTERRKWAVREIQAMAARAAIGMGQWHEGLRLVESIADSDPSTRHLVELPLVWDERLPEQSRISLPVSDLQSESIPRRLTAASALLSQAEHEEACLAALKLLSKSSDNRTAQMLAETQLWRTTLLHPDQLQETTVRLWQRRVKQLERRMRSGPEFLIGRARLLLHDYDSAATSLLWMPLLEPLDPWTTQASLTDAVSALELAGRKAEASSLRQRPGDVSNPG